MSRPQSTLVGQLLDGRFELLHRIGEGGMGVVYKAAEKSSGRVLAIKVLNPYMAGDPNWVQRFYNEAKATSALRHPNTIEMFEFGQTREGVLFLAMELLDGLSLRAAINQGPMPPVRVLNVLAQSCASLSEAHAVGIIHRDMKPDNIFLLNRNGREHIKVLDFSVAKLLADRGFRTAAGMVFGTPEYMSPEQGRGRQLDSRSDLYALGCIGYEMLLGRVPFTDTNPMAILQAHMTAPPPPLPPSVPAGLQEILLRCLDKEPGRRYPTALQMQEACEAVMRQLGAEPVVVEMPRGGGSPAPAPAPTARPAAAGSAAQKTIMADSPLAGEGAPPPAKAAAQKTLFAAQSPLGGPPPPVGGPPPAAAGPSPPAGPPSGPPPVAGPPSGPPVAASNQKTMFAPQPGAAAAPPAASGGAGAKTVVAGNAADLLRNLRPPSMEATPAPGPPAGAPAGAPGPNPGAPGGGRTIMLQPSDGVVSFSMRNRPPPRDTEVGFQGGASPLFWALCLVTGTAVGVGAYFMVLALGG
jgi:serine/threonine-protein kinase